MRLIVPLLFTISCGLLCATEPQRKSKTIVTIGAETTVLTEPLDAAGYVDYLAAINARCRVGVTYDNNAAVLLWQAYGPQGMDAEVRDEAFKLLEMTPPGADGEYFISMEKFSPDKAEELQRQFDKASRRLWTSEDYPLLAKWLEANEAPLKLAAAASSRPRCYHPYVTSSKSHRLTYALLPHASHARGIARALVARAMQQAGTMRTDAAVDDLLTVHRLARLHDQGPTLVEGLVAIAIDHIAFNAEAALAHSGKLSAAELQRLQREIASLAPLSPMKDRIDEFERYALLDSAICVACDVETATEVEISIEAAKRFFPGMHADETLRIGNAWCNRLAAAFDVPNFPERTQQFDEIKKEIVQLGADLPKHIRRLDYAIGDKRKALQGKIAGDLLVTLFLRGIGRAHISEQQSRMQHELTVVSLALAACREETGEFPADLEKLVPEYLDKVPADAFIEAPLRYTPQENGFVLYSVGANMQDDSGIDREETKERDDIVIRSAGRE